MFGRNETKLVMVTRIKPIRATKVLRMTTVYMSSFASKTPPKRRGFGQFPLK
jgi:hypothetical protein